MTTGRPSARTPLQQAIDALKRGDKLEARRLAQMAVEAQPGREETWLVLAAAVEPEDSLQYLQKALQINPESQRARQGIHWALQRQRTTLPDGQQPARLRMVGEPDEGATTPIPVASTQPVRVAQAGHTMPVRVKPDLEATAPHRVEPGSTTPFTDHTAPVAIPTGPVRAASQRRAGKVVRKKTGQSAMPYVLIPALLAMAVVIMAGILYFAMPGGWDTVFADYSAERPQGVLLKPSLTPTRTPTATQTPTLTPTATPTSTQTPTPEPTSTATPVPTNTPEPPPVEEVHNPPPAAGTGEGRWIDINLSEQMVYAYEDDTVVNSFLVSTGTWEHPTVTGQFYIYVKYEAADMAGPGYYLPSVPYVMYFYKGYGLHGTYWHSNFGTPMSHGCINLRTDDAGWLFGWASVGTLVNIHY